MIPELDRAFSACGAAAWGGLAWADALPHFSPQAVEKTQALCPRPGAVLVAAFPYYAGDAPGNLSLYARGRDYHLVLTEKLNTVCDVLRQKYPSYLFLPGADSSPLPERQLAWACGIGLRGQNGLLILPPWGSYVFLGTILTDCPLEFSTQPPANVCISCGKCAAACPGGALDGAVFHLSRCLSDISQKKGALSPEEAALLSAQACLWGCDLCQRVCPYNARPAMTPIPDFRENLISSLSPADLEGLTNRTFREKYGDRAFAWRGPAVLRRNLALREHG